MPRAIYPGEVAPHFLRLKEVFRQIHGAAHSAWPEFVEHTLAGPPLRTNTQSTVFREWWIQRSKTLAFRADFGAWRDDDGFEFFESAAGDTIRLHVTSPSLIPWLSSSQRAIDWYGDPGLLPLQEVEKADVAPTTKLVVAVVLDKALVESPRVFLSWTDGAQLFDYVDLDEAFAATDNPPSIPPRDSHGGSFVRREDPREEDTEGGREAADS